jgi:hypothetical protein
MKQECDDHRPLALQEILLAGCPTVGVRTGASFVRHGETGIFVNRLPLGASCLECDEDAAALDAFVEGFKKARMLNRQSVHDIAADQFSSEPIVEKVMSSIAVDSDLGYAKFIWECH